MTSPLEAPGTLILVTRDGMGQAAVSLRHKLMHTYLTLLDQDDVLPGAIAFYAEGVKLVVRGSPVLDLLHSLEAKGVHLIICNTCPQYYDLADEVQVGIIGGMTDIIAAMWKADKVITL